MKKDSNLLIKILLAGLAVLLIIYFTYNRQHEIRYQWSETYKSTSDQPYGTLFIQKLLSTYRPGLKFILNDQKPLHQVLDSSERKTGADYVFIGQNIFLDTADTKALLNFIYSGNDAFIATVNLPFDLIDPIFVPECESEIFLETNDTLSITQNFYNTRLKNDRGYRYAYRFGKTDLPYFWNTLNPEVFCDSTKSITPLGFIYPGKVNFFRLSHGKGQLYIHTNPIVFTNYFLTKSDKAEYASGVFSHLNADSIIWDEFSKAEFATKNNAPQVNPIAYILENDSLRYAWWLMLGGAFLYTVFTAKRKQRIIPVLEPKSNTSLEFVNMISALHLENGNPHDIARKKVKYFNYFIKAKYGIHTQDLNETHLKRLSAKSKVSLSDLQLVANEVDSVHRQPYYDETMLMELYKTLETFYKNCK